MAELKTQPTKLSPIAFIEAVSDLKRRADCMALLKLMKKVSQCEPTMWGPSIIGFGDFHYRYDSGREGDTFIIGFSPRKNALTLYLGACLEAQQTLLARLGKHKTGKGCIYIQHLADVHLPTLTALLTDAAKRSSQKK